MNNVPEGAQLSPDGHYWWDGSAWQPVQGASGAAQGGSAQGGQAAASGGHSLVEAFAAQGVTVDASHVADAQAVGRTHAQLTQWYGALDGTAKAVVDVLCSNGMTHMLADPEVGVVQEGAELLYALASTGYTLAGSIQATQQALDLHGQQNPQSGSGTAQA